MEGKRVGFLHDTAVESDVTSCETLGKEELLGCVGKEGLSGEEINEFWKLQDKLSTASAIPPGYKKSCAFVGIDEVTRQVPSPTLAYRGSLVVSS